MKKILIVLSVVVSMLGSFVLGTHSVSQNAGSVSVGSSYAYKAVTSASASATVPVKVRGGRSVLGSIVVMGTSSTAVRVYDAGTATSSATLITTLPAGSAQGTYTFDIDMVNGIVLDVPAGYAGSLIVTSRN